MTQEPWNEEIYETSETSRRGRTEKRDASTTAFTILAVLFVIIAIAITAFAVYLSTGGSQTNSSEEFYHTSTPQSSAVASSSPTEAPASTEPSTEPSSTEDTTASSSSLAAVEGETITVNPGEGEASIAARAGISIAELERLNPEKMTTGTWLAHPGDVVRIK